MRKISVFLLCIIAAGILAGCGNLGINEGTTIFKSFNVKEQNGSIVSEGEVKVHIQNAALLTVDAPEETTGTFHIRYTKEEGALDIGLNGETVLSLEEGSVSGVMSEDIEVKLKKGRNDFLISGEDSTCKYTLTLTVPDTTLNSFGTGSLGIVNQ